MDAAVKEDHLYFTWIIFYTAVQRPLLIKKTYKYVKITIVFGAALNYFWFDQNIPGKIKRTFESRAMYTGTVEWKV